MASPGRNSSTWVVMAPWARAVSTARRHQRLSGTSGKEPVCSTSSHWKKRQRTETKAPRVMGWPRPKVVAVLPWMSPACAERRMASAAQWVDGTSRKLPLEAAETEGARESVSARARKSAGRRRNIRMEKTLLFGAATGWMGVRAAGIAADAGTVVPSL